MLCGLRRLPSFPGTASSSGCRLVACSTWSAPSTPSGDVALDLDCPRPVETVVQLPANFCRRRSSQGRSLRRSDGHRDGSAVAVLAEGVGRSRPTSATPSAATAFSACRPEDAKSHPKKMFELSGFREATTAGNWRHRNLLGTLCIRRSLVGVGAPRRTSGCWRRYEGAALRLVNIIVHPGTRGLPSRPMLTSSLRDRNSSPPPTAIKPCALPKSPSRGAGDNDPEQKFTRRGHDAEDQARSRARDRLDH